MGIAWAALAGLLICGGLIYRRVMWPGILKTGKGQRKIACVGDSITYSLGVLGRRKKKSYPAALARLMGPGYCAWNYGLSDRALLSTSDKPYFQEKLGKAAWAAQAEWVIFMLGSNDCKRKNWNAARFEEEYRAAVHHFMESGAKVCVLIPPRIFYPRPGRSGYDDAILRDELAPIVRRVAAERGIPCIDLYALTKDHASWFPDQLHPNAAGNEAIAREIAAHIAKL